MPKQKLIIREFSGGMNTKRDPRDLAENESSLLINMSVDAIGKIKTAGGFYDSIISNDGVSFTNATCDYDDDPTIGHDADPRIVVGLSVSGTGIPAGSTVASINSTTGFELSASTTGGAVTNGTLTFKSQLDEHIPGTTHNITDVGGYGVTYFESDYSRSNTNTITETKSGTPLALGTSNGQISFLKVETEVDPAAYIDVFLPE